MNAQDTICLLVRQHLDFAFCLPHRTGASVGDKGKDSFAVFDAFLFQLFFCFSDGGDFRIGIGNTGNRIVINVTITCHQALGKCDSFVFRFMCQHGAADNIADGEDAFDGGFVMGVDRDKPSFIQRDPDFFQTQVVRIGTSPHRDENPVATDRLGVGNFNITGLFVGFHSGHPAAQLKFNPLFFEDLLCLFGDFQVGGRQDAIQVFQHGDFRSQAAPDGPEFQANHTAANHDKMFGNLLVGKGFRTCADTIAVEFDSWQGGRFTTGGNQNVFGFQLGSFIAIIH